MELYNPYGKWKSLGIYSMSLIVIGTIGNLTILIVCLSKRLRNIPTFVFLAFLLAVDTLALYWTNMAIFYQTFFNQWITNINIFHCKTNVLFQAATLQGKQLTNLQFYMNYNIFSIIPISKCVVTGMIKPLLFYLLDMSILFFCFLMNFIK